MLRTLLLTLACAAMPASPQSREEAMAVSSLRSLAQIEHRTGPVRCDTVWHHGAPGQPLTTRGEGAYHVCQVAEATYYCRYHTDRTRGLYVWDDCIPYLD